MYSPDEAHSLIFDTKPLLAFDESKDFLAQKERITKKLIQLLGDMPEKAELNPVVEYQKEFEKYTEYRIRFTVEVAVQAVCLLCIPRTGKTKYPLAICLQGHTQGMQISVGRSYNGNARDDGDRDIALQAMEHGYAALCLEQRGMGERRTDKAGNRDDDGAPRCHITAMNALLTGRTMIGERCFDVSRAIDLALTFKAIDGDRIVCTGNSGGGTTTYYAACLDERIKVAMPSCAVCTFKSSIAAMSHCQCNFIPGIAKYMDMGDMAAAIAPRKLIVIHGKDDPIFPEKGVRAAFDTIERIYRAAGVPENCVLLTGNGGHRYYGSETWKELERLYILDTSKHFGT